METMLTEMSRTRLVGIWFGIVAAVVAAIVVADVDTAVGTAPYVLMLALLLPAVMLWSMRQRKLGSPAYVAIPRSGEK